MSDPLLEHLQTTLGDAYRIERELGGGGMGRVFVAEETTLERRVVVKVLPPELGRGLSAERFRREIQLAAKLQHPHIVPLLAAGGTADGTLYYTMPFIEGDSLRRRLTRAGELPIPEALRILRQVVDALAYAHARGVVHRDIKPDNILISGNHALVTDFGVSKALSTATGETSLTSLGVALGTPAYMAPEQAAADPNTDHRADIYAVGVLAYELLAGHPPFQGTSAQQVLAAHATLPPPRITPLRATVPQQLEDLVMRCLEKHAADRPQSAEELLQVLETLSTPSHGTTPAPFQPVRAAKGRGVAGRAIAVGATAGVIALAALGALWLRRDTAPSGLVDTRVFVAPFENRTGDAALEPLGQMASEAVGRMLVDQASLEIVEADPSRGAIAESQLASTARARGAATIVRGTYYRLGDSLQFQAALLDARDGRVLRTLGPFVAPTSAPNSAIEPLAQRVTGGLAVMTRTTLGRDLATTLPRFDAYREYLQGDESYLREDLADQTLRHFFRAYAIDTLYTWPLVRAAYVGANTRNCRLTDSIAMALAPARQRMAAGEAAYLDRVLAWCRGDYAAAYSAAVRIRRAAPGSDEVAYIVAYAALQVNRPHEALAALRSLRQRSRLLLFHTWHADAWHLLGEYARELDVMRKASREYPETAFGPWLEARALAALRRTSDADAAIRRAESLDLAGFSYGGLLLGHGAEVGFHGDMDGAQGYFERAAEWFNTQPATRRTWWHRVSHVWASGMSGRTEEALTRARTLVSEFPDSLIVHEALGVAAARAGDMALADSTDAWLAGYHGSSGSGGSSLGRNVYARALIAAARGDRARAVALLQQAVSEGMPYLVADWHRDPALVGLRDYEPYRALAKPRD